LKKRVHQRCSICGKPLSRTSGEREIQKFGTLWLITDYRCDKCGKDYQMMVNQRLLENDDEPGVIGMMIQVEEKINGESIN
jgi:DNA-directed RNA polymerase subunit RPC12/RpoP